MSVDKFNDVVLDIQAQNPAFFINNPNTIHSYYSINPDRATERYILSFAENMDLPIGIKNQIHEAFLKFLA